MYLIPAIIFFVFESCVAVRCDSITFVFRCQRYFLDFRDIQSYQLLEDLKLVKKCLFCLFCFAPAFGHTLCCKIVRDCCCSRPFQPLIFRFAVYRYAVLIQAELHKKLFKRISQSLCNLFRTIPKKFILCGNIAHLICRPMIDQF